MKTLTYTPSLALAQHPSLRQRASLALAVASIFVATGVSAQEAQGRVISSTALITQVSTPRQVCNQEVVQVTTPAARQDGHSGAGALIGGLIGGAFGNSIGQGNGRAAATALGLFGGAILGDRIGGEQNATVQPGTTSSQTVNRCSTQNVLENKVTGYQVVYEYAGKQYSVQMPNDPGPTIPLQVTPVLPAQAPAQPVPNRVISQAPAPAPEVFVAQASTPVVVAPSYGSTVITSSTIYQPYLVPSVTYVPAPAVVVAPHYRHHGGVAQIVLSNQNRYPQRYPHSFPSHGDRYPLIWR
jgi:uncharacterized protein YcfJ